MNLAHRQQEQHIGTKCDAKNQNLTLNGVQLLDILASEAGHVRCAGAKKPIVAALGRVPPTAGKPEPLGS